jgi:hypothetical protein
MRRLASVLLLGIAMTGGAFAQDIRIGPGGVRVVPRERVYGGDYCRELRQACMHKEELGEEGAGNCRRYRERCQGGGHRQRYYPD